MPDCEYICFVSPAHAGVCLWPLLFHRRISVRTVAGPAALRPAGSMTVQTGNKQCPERNPLFAPVEGPNS